MNSQELTALKQAAVAFNAADDALHRARKAYVAALAAYIAKHSGGVSGRVRGSWRY